MAPIFSLLIPFAVDLIRWYILSSDSSKDDKILYIIQDGCRYLAEKDTNNLSMRQAKEIEKVEFWGGKK